LDGRRFRPYRWRLARHAVVVIAEAAHMPVDRRCGQTTWRQLLQAIGRLHAVLDQKLEDANGGKMAALPVGGTDLHGGDDLAPALDFGRRHDARSATISAMCVAGTPVAPQQPVQRRATDRVKLSGRRQQSLTLRMSAGQCGQPAAERRECLNRHTGEARRHYGAPNAR
jgi:hypothetical protein